MSEYKSDGSPKERRLTDIIREVKISEADHRDVVIDMRDADKARLELLAEELAPVIADIDSADQRFDMGISSGQQPRFWIDAVAHVHMGPDRRIYRFVRDTRLGRVVLSESSAVGETAHQVARYVAQRIIEREQALSGDFEPAVGTPIGPAAVSAPSHPAEDSAKWSMPMDEDDTEPETVPGEPAASPVADEPSNPAQPLADFPERKPARGAGFVIGASWFILGCVAGAAALIVAFWGRISGLIG